MWKEIIVNCTTGETIIRADTFLPWKRAVHDLELSLENEKAKEKETLCSGLVEKLKRLGLTEDEISAGFNLSVRF